MKKSIRINEIFGPTVQGEGPLIGRPTIFVRTASCDYRCKWCDTLYAVLPEYRDEWSLMSPTDIIARVDELAGGRPILISLSGGNPALQPLDKFISLGRARGHSFVMETQGSVSRPWFSDLDWLILSPKPPSSGMETDWNTLEECIVSAKGKMNCVLKIVVFDESDYAYARAVALRFPKVPIYLQVGNSAPLLAIGKSMPDKANFDDLFGRLRWLIDRVVIDRWFEVTVLPQLHVLTWGNKRGV